MPLTAVFLPFADTQGGPSRRPLGHWAGIDVNRRGRVNDDALLAAQRIAVHGRSPAKAVRRGEASARGAGVRIANRRFGTRMRLLRRRNTTRR